jgi:hypothetical protein
VNSILSSQLVEQFRRAVALSNPTSLHALDERRFEEFFDAASEAGHDLIGRDIDSIWPTETVSGLGGDPANSEYLKDRVYGLLADWTKRHSGKANR